MSSTAIDTNVLVRFLTRDDERQAQIARAAIQSQTIWLTKTVLLETEWVLRFSYNFSQEKVNQALRAVLGLPQIAIESAEQVLLALNWHSLGMDFADALHLAGSASVEKFVTFDQKFAKLANTLKCAPSVEPLT